MECRLTVIGNRTNGKPKYWCMTHGSYAWDEQGQPLTPCPNAASSNHERTVLQLNLQDYPGGIGIWAALCPVYDTTQLSKAKRDVGVHVHARKAPDKPKEVDDTFDVVYLKTGDTKVPVEINREDAAALSLSLLVGYQVSVVQCSHCSTHHSDLGYFAVQPHRKHICLQCGRDFWVKHPNIGNPLALIGHHLPQDTNNKATIKTDRKLVIEQRSFAGGMRIWISHNPAILLTPDRPEVEGMHIHCYGQNSSRVIDDTFGSVEIDGIVIDAEMVRKYMVQINIEYLKRRTVSLQCPYCGTAHFDSGENAWMPHIEHTCHVCDKSFEAAAKYRKVVSNPLIGQLDLLQSRTTAGNAPTHL